MGHWYDRQGNKVYQVPMKTKPGQMRDVHIGDARKMNLVPGYSGVWSLRAAPQLEKWKTEQAILAALTLPRKPNEPDSSYLERVWEDSWKQAKKARDEGSNVHDAIERSFRGEWFDSQYEPHVEAVRKKLDDLYPGVSWNVERSFAHCLGYGGCIDISSEGLVGDHKGKDGDFSDGKQLAYDQNVQLGCYAQGIGGILEGFNIFFSRTHPGKVVHHIWTQKDLKRGAERFNAALNLWQVENEFDTRF